MSDQTLVIVDAFLKAGELTDALEVLEAQLDATPDAQDLIRLRVSILCRLPDRETDALEAFSSLNALTAEDYIRQSVLQRKIGAHQAAVQTLLEACSTFPNDERLAETAFHTFLELDGGQDAQSLIQTWLTKQPDSWQWQQHAGDLAASTDHHEIAVEQYSEAVQLLTKHIGEGDDANKPIQAILARILAARGTSYWRLKRYAEADADYQHASEIVPNDAMLTFNRGLIATANDDAQSAVNLIQTALSTATPSQKNAIIEQLHLEYPQIAAQLILG